MCVTVHGFPLCVPDWCGEETSFRGMSRKWRSPTRLGIRLNELIGAAMLSRDGERVMNAWASFLSESEGNVIPLGRT
jgi:hypothetical protein